MTHRALPSRLLCLLRLVLVAWAACGPAPEALGAEALTTLPADAAFVAVWDGAELRVRRSQALTAPFPLRPEEILLIPLRGRSRLKVHGGPHAWGLAYGSSPQAISALVWNTEEPTEETTVRRAPHSLARAVAIRASAAEGATLSVTYDAPSARTPLADYRLDQAVLLGLAQGAALPSAGDADGGLALDSLQARSTAFSATLGAHLPPAVGQHWLSAWWLVDRVHSRSLSEPYFSKTEVLARGARPARVATSAEPWLVAPDARVQLEASDASVADLELRVTGTVPAELVVSIGELPVKRLRVLPNAPTKVRLATFANPVTLRAYDATVEVVATGYRPRRGLLDGQGAFAPRAHFEAARAALAPEASLPAAQLMDAALNMLLHPTREAQHRLSRECEAARAVCAGVSSAVLSFGSAVGVDGADEGRAHLLEHLAALPGGVDANVATHDLARVASATDARTGTATSVRLAAAVGPLKRAALAAVVAPEPTTTLNLAIAAQTDESDVFASSTAYAVARRAWLRTTPFAQLKASQGHPRQTLVALPSHGKHARCDTWPGRTPRLRRVTPKETPHYVEAPDGEKAIVRFYSEKETDALEVRIDGEPLYTHPRLQSTISALVAPGLRTFKTRPHGDSWAQIPSHASLPCSELRELRTYFDAQSRPVFDVPDGPARPLRIAVAQDPHRQTLTRLEVSLDAASYRVEATPTTATSFELLSADGPAQLRIASIDPVLVRAYHRWSPTAEPNLDDSETVASRWSRASGDAAVVQPRTLAAAMRPLPPVTAGGEEAFAEAVRLRDADPARARQLLTRLAAGPNEARWLLWRLAETEGRFQEAKDIFNEFEGMFSHSRTSRMTWQRKRLQLWVEASAAEGSLSEARSAYLATRKARNLGIPVAGILARYREVVTYRQLPTHGTGKRPALLNVAGGAVGGAEVEGVPLRARWFSRPVRIKLAPQQGSLLRLSARCVSHDPDNPCDVALAIDDEEELLCRPGQTEGGRDCVVRWPDDAHWLRVTPTTGQRAWLDILEYTPEGRWQALPHLERWTEITSSAAYEADVRGPAVLLVDGRSVGAKELVLATEARQTRVRLAQEPDPGATFGLELPSTPVRVELPLDTAGVHHVRIYPAEGTALVRLSIPTVVAAPAPRPAETPNVPTEEPPTEMIPTSLALRAGARPLRPPAAPLPVYPLTTTFRTSAVDRDVLEVESAPRDRYLELAGSVHRRWRSGQTTAAALVRVRESSPSVALYLHGSVPSTQLTPGVFGHVQVTQMPNENDRPLGIRGRLGIIRSWAVSPDLRMGPIVSFEARSTPQAARALVDQDVWSRYAAAHPFTMTAGLRLSHRAWVDTLGIYSLEARGGSPMDELDRVTLLAQWWSKPAQALPLGHLLTSASYRPANSFRAEDFLRLSCGPSLSIISWLSRTQRLVLSGEVSAFFDVGSVQRGGAFGRINLSWDAFAPDLSHLPLGERRLQDLQEEQGVTGAAL